MVDTSYTSTPYVFRKYTFRRIKWYQYQLVIPPVRVTPKIGPFWARTTTLSTDRRRMNGAEKFQHFCRLYSFRASERADSVDEHWESDVHEHTSSAVVTSINSCFLLRFSSVLCVYCLSNEMDTLLALDRIWIHFSVSVRCPSIRPVFGAHRPDCKLNFGPIFIQLETQLLLNTRKNIFGQFPKWAWSGSRDEICNFTPP